MNEQEYNNIETKLTLCEAFKFVGEDYSKDSLVKLISVDDKKRWTIVSVKSCLESKIKGVSVYGIRAWFANEEFKGYKYYVEDSFVDEEWLY